MSREPDDRAPNRRLGHRVQPEHLELAWILPDTVPGHRRAKKRSPVARVVDLSFTGMQVLAPHDPHLGRGHVIEVELEGIRTPVRIRWVRGTDQPGWAMYGIELVRQSQELSALVSRIIQECDARAGVELRDEPNVRRPYW